MTNKKTILITGGHFSPAYALIPSLIEKQYRIVFVGRKHVFSNHNDESLEWKLLSKTKEVVFHPLTTGRFTKGAWRSLPTELSKMKEGLFQAFQILKKEKPYLVISFGGYLAVPVCVVARLLRIPIVLHEQTIAPGRANRLLALIAKRIYVSFPSSSKYFPISKCQVLGLPLRPELDQVTQPRWYTKSKRPLILVLGGSSGSHSVNMLIERNLTSLTNKFDVVQQTGDNEYRDYERLTAYKNPHYTVLKHLLPSEIGFLYTRAALVVSRSGANTFFELLKFRKPAVLIPLPWAANNEQLKHAQILQEKGVALIVSQTDTAETLLAKINEVYTNRQRYTQNFINLQKYDELILQPTIFLKELGL